MNFNNLTSDQLQAVLLTLESFPTTVKELTVVKNHMTIVRNIINRKTTNNFTEVPQCIFYCRGLSPELFIVGNKAGLYRLQSTAEKARLFGKDKKSLFTNNGDPFHVEMILDGKINMKNIPFKFKRNIEEDEFKQIKKQF